MLCIHSPVRVANLTILLYRVVTFSIVPDVHYSEACFFFFTIFLLFYFSIFVYFHIFDVFDEITFSLLYILYVISHLSCVLHVTGEWIWDTKVPVGAVWKLLPWNKGRSATCNIKCKYVDDDFRVMEDNDKELFVYTRPVCPRPQ